MIHTDFKFHRQITQIGCYWGGGGHTELYLLEGDRLALMDTGVAETPAAYVEPALNAVGRTLKDIEVVINTHGHHDHAGGNHAVWAASACEIWIHADDVEITQSPEAQFDRFFARNLRLRGRLEVEHAEDGASAGAPTRGRAGKTSSGWGGVYEAARADIAANAGPPAPIARTFGDGDRLDLGRGLELRVVHTPGHTLGCCTFMWEREGVAIQGDSVLGRGSRPGGMPLIFYPNEYRHTIERVRQLRPRSLCLGHHYRTLRQTNESIRHGDLVDAFLDESIEIADLIESATDRAVTTLGRDAPFESILRHALTSLADQMPLLNDAGSDVPNGAVAPISAFWSLRTGQPA